KGDETVVNPTTTAFLRAGDLADWATYYRHDLAYADNQANPSNPPMVTNPHTFAALINSLASPNPTSWAIARAAQEQIVAFLKSGGTQIIQPPGLPTKYFELLTKNSPLTEDLNLLVPPVTTAGAPAQASGSLAFGPIPTGGATNPLNGEPPEWLLPATPV